VGPPLEAPGSFHAHPAVYHHRLVPDSPTCYVMTQPPPPLMSMTQQQQQSSRNEHQQVEREQAPRFNKHYNRGEYMNSGAARGGVGVASAPMLSAGVGIPDDSSSQSSSSDVLVQVTLRSLYLFCM